ncbi:MAG TPA: type 4a pilus biogenesis protein PilO [bacterium]|nr:type 4a pilus biogenesis protein PilO [bacterium]HPJ71898.1 type 4a pilus biogenesis protein PilO [bacterium]HPQ66757.1 type 4a pilus biogenesis protein PilO [bacterium]
MNYSQKALLSIVALFIVLLGFVAIVYLPRSRELEALEARSRELDAEIDGLRRRQVALPDIARQIAEVREELGRLEEQYPRAIETVYQAITVVSRRNDFTILNNRTVGRPEKKTDGKDASGEGTKSLLQEWDIKIEARSGYASLGDFLHDVTHLPVLIVISGLTATASPEGEEPGQLDVSLDLTTYLSRNGE